MQHLAGHMLQLFLYSLANANTQRLGDLFSIETVLAVSLEILITEIAELVDPYTETHSVSYNLLTLASIQRNRFENIFIEDSKLV